MSRLYGSVMAIPTLGASDPKQQDHAEESGKEVD
jgi:hypothetical protein